jgi:hypothetical protein
MTVQLLLLGLAFVCFIAGVIDNPPITSGRMIALGLALVTLAQLVGGR